MVVGAVVCVVVCMVVSSSVRVCSAVFSVGHKLEAGTFSPVGHTYGFCIMHPELINASIIRLIITIFFLIFYASKMSFMGFVSWVVI